MLYGKEMLMNQHMVLGWKDNVKEEAALSNPATEHLTSQIQEGDCDSCTI